MNLIVERKDKDIFEKEVRSLLPLCRLSGLWYNFHYASFIIDSLTDADLIILKLKVSSLKVIAPIQNPC